MIDGHISRILFEVSECSSHRAHPAHSPGRETPLCKCLLEDRSASVIERSDLFEAALAETPIHHPGASDGALACHRHPLCGIGRRLAGWLAEEFGRKRSLHTNSQVEAIE